MNKKNLSTPQTILNLAFMTLLHSIAVLGVYLMTELPYNIPELLCFTPLLIPIVADLLLRKLTDIKPYVTLISASLAVIICFFFYLICPNFSEDNYMFFGETYIFFLLALISFAVRCLYSIFDFTSIGKLKQIVAGLLVAVIGIGSTVCGFVFEDDINRYMANKSLGIADKTSWGSINQNVERGDDWQQIVTDTPFKLGEITTVTEEGFSNNYCDIGTYPHIDGSTVCVPMAVEFARQHLSFEDLTANQFVQFSTTHHAYENLMDPMNQSQNYVHYNLDAFIKMGSVDLVIATEPSDAEIKQAEIHGVTFKKVPVCYDAFVFITHKDNPIESLTVEQIQKIYTGEIKNWKEVGGKDEKIRAFQREKNSGSQTAMENLVMGGADMIDPIEVKIIVGMGELVDAVAEYENETASLGYTYRYYIDTLYKNDNIKTIAVNGIAPTDENIRNGSYPFTTNYYGVIREGDEDEIGGQFLQWILSDEGQKCVAQAGYITLR